MPWQAHNAKVERRQRLAGGSRSAADARRAALLVVVDSKEERRCAFVNPVTFTSWTGGESGRPLVYTRTHPQLLIPLVADERIEAGKISLSAY